jgi:DNA end-binding protein Ku
MAARAISSGTISFGLVSIPVKLYTATSAQQAHFNMLHGPTKSRVKQQYIVPGSGEIADRKQMVKGYEYSKGQYVVFTDDELKSLEAKRSQSLDIVEFVPLDSVDLIHVEKTYYLGPDKGGDKAYRLLAEAMRTSGKVAVGRWAAKGKEQLVLIRPYKDGLMLHQLYYANEVRAFDDVETGATFEFSELERDLAQKLISELSVKQFDATKYKDEFAVRVMAAVDQKVAGEQVHVAQEVPRAQIIDLFEALKQSLAQTQGGAQAQGGALAATGTDSPNAREPSLDEVKPRPVEKAKPRKAAAKKKTG